MEIIILDLLNFKLADILMYLQLEIMKEEDLGSKILSKLNIKCLILINHKIGIIALILIKLILLLQILMKFKEILLMDPMYLMKFINL